MSKKLVLGVGINNSESQVSKYELINGKYKLTWSCPYYERWKSMLTRCYSAKFLERYPTYKGCTVCKDWLIFSSFKEWMQTKDWNGKHLDKDILIKGSNMYSPESCSFVSDDINLFFTDRRRFRGNYKLGVSFHAKSGKFQARCRNPFTRKLESIGMYDLEIDAHNAYLAMKIKMAIKLSKTVKDKDIRDAIVKFYV